MPLARYSVSHFIFHYSHVQRISFNVGILVNGEQLNNIKYEDDTVVLSGSLERLQQFLTNVTETSSTYGLDFNINKTICTLRARPDRKSVV